MGGKISLFSTTSSLAWKREVKPELTKMEYVEPERIIEEITLT